MPRRHSKSQAEDFKKRAMINQLLREARLAVGLASSAMRRRGSELEPQRELDLALAVRGFWNDSGRAGNLIARENDQLGVCEVRMIEDVEGDRKSTRLNSSHANISYAVFCLKKKKTNK